MPPDAICERAHLISAAPYGRSPPALFPTGQEPEHHGRSAIRLSHAGGLQDLSRREAGLRQYPPVLPAGCQDRCGRRQWRGEIDPAENHGRCGYRVQWRSLGGRWHQGRLPAPRAPARCQQERDREYRIRGAGKTAPGEVQRGLGKARRGLFRRVDGRDDRAAGADRRGRCLGCGFQDPDGHGRPALSGRFRRCLQPVGRGNPPRGDLPAPPVKARHDPDGRADEPSRRRDGGLASELSDQFQWLRDPGHPRPLFPR